MKNVAARSHDSRDPRRPVVHLALASERVSTRVETMPLVSSPNRRREISIAGPGRARIRSAQRSDGVTAVQQVGPDSIDTRTPADRPPLRRTRLDQLLARIQQGRVSRPLTAQTASIGGPKDPVSTPVVSATAALPVNRLASRRPSVRAPVPLTREPRLSWPQPNPSSVWRLDRARLGRTSLLEQHPDCHAYTLCSANAIVDCRDSLSCAVE